ncbi:MAG: arylsulfatase [Bacteroidales bacterium]|nr:arylsulfatase [Bacteroidales bacterium]
MKKISVYKLYFLVINVLVIVSGCSNKESQKQAAPHIILIMADDMGFSDLGFMGSGIETPNLDKLAANGITYTQFYNTSSCCPTRASLMTGLYQHQAGMGWMTAANLGSDGYTGDLNKQCVTLAQMLQKRDYACYMTGKWHITADKYMHPDSSKHNWPIQRGFDKYYGHLSGGGGYYNPKNLIYNNDWLQIPDNFYLTTAVSDSTVSLLRQHFESGNENPLFTYVAYYAPHRPLHALQKDITKYRGRFMKGWDKLREEKLQKLYEIGVADSSWLLTDRGEGIPAWDELGADDQKIWDARMAVYAAQIDCMDQGIGQIMDVLKSYDQLDNTLILFLSDNGGCAEQQEARNKTELTLENIDSLGNQYPMSSYEKPWANLSNVPFKMYKQYVHEGGIATPLIAHWPEKIKAKGELINQVGHVIDIMPTFLEIANIDYPAHYKGHDLKPLAGNSLLRNFSGETFERDAIFFEHNGNLAVRQGDWKLVSKKNYTRPASKGPWELYNLASDRSETTDLVEIHPDKAKELEQLWNKWAAENNVLPVDYRGWGEKTRR